MFPDLNRTDYRLFSNLCHAQRSCFLVGSLTADLNKFPRGAKTAEGCTLITKTMPTINLFKQRRVKGWWPFERVEGNSVTLAVSH